MVRYVSRKGNPPIFLCRNRQVSGFHRVAAETPAVERGTWFDTCPGRGCGAAEIIVGCELLLQLGVFDVVEIEENACSIASRCGSVSGPGHR